MDDCAWIPWAEGYPQYFSVTSCHTQDGWKQSSGVLKLPDGWDKPGFEWPLSSRGMDEASTFSGQIERRGRKLGSKLEIF